MLCAASPSSSRAGAVWSLPIYELALMTAAYSRAHELDVELALVTPEEEPLQLFGDAGSEAVRELLDESGVALRTATYPSDVVDGGLAAGARGTDSLPTASLRCLCFAARGSTAYHRRRDGFIPVDEYGRVRGLDDVFAAGDITNFPVKQGGIATQQADAAAEDRRVRRRRPRARAVPARCCAGSS